MDYNVIGGRRKDKSLHGYVIGHDIGTGGCKSVLATTGGELLARSFEPYPIYHPRPNWAEQDPGDWWRATASATRRMMGESGIDPGRVVGLGFAGQMLGIVPVGGEGAPLCRAIIWLDSRADEQAARIIRRFGGRRVVIRVAGAEPSGKDVICKLAWLRENEPELFRSTRCFLDATGYLVHRATGEMAMDHTGAGGTGILAGRRREWSRPLARLVGLDLEKMPPIRSSIDVVGTLREEAAREMGLDAGTPVIAGMSDIPAAAAGSGALDDGDAHINIGTSSWLCLSVSRPRNLGRNGIAPVVSADPDMYLMIGESETAGACLEWFAGNLYPPDAMGREDGEGDVFRALDGIVVGTGPGAGRMLFAPWMFGERSPVTDTSVRASFVNLSLEHGRDHMLRAIYEGVAFNLRWLLDAAAGAGFACDPLRAIGGGAKSDVWMQIIADVTRRRVEAVEHPQEAGAMGCALAAALAVGERGSFRLIKEAVRVRKSFEPRPDCCPIYDELYGAFRCLYPRLSGACARLNRAAAR
ncbi:MAG: FGGY-family carbohydrate kinase [Actinomycetota bacterium]